MTLGGAFGLTQVRHLSHIQWRAFTQLEERTLLRILEVILPSHLTAGDLEHQLRHLKQWLASYPGEGERYHMQDEYIWFRRGLYLPPSPAQNYSSQLKRLRQQTHHLYGEDFCNLDREKRGSVVKGLLSEVRISTLPPTPQGHLIVDLLCLYYRDPSVVDACFGRKIGYRTCRGLVDVGSMPDKV